MSTQIVILAAGMGSRLGRSLPKPLTELADGRTIMKQQFDNIHHAFGDNAARHDRRRLQARAHHRGVPRGILRLQRAVRPDEHVQEPPARARASAPGGVLWMNGDIVFDPKVAGARSEDHRARPVVRHRQHLQGEPTKKSSTRRTPTATSSELSKTVEAASARPSASTTFRGATRQCWSASSARVDDQDYFERGIELAIEQDGVRFEPVNISDLYAVEIDFAEDLERANLFV